MSVRQISVGILGFAVIILLGFRSAGWVALLGTALGLAVSGISIGSLALIVNRLSQTQPSPRHGTSSMMLVNILKLPVLVAGLYWGTRLPTVAVYCFLAGIGLVYFLSVWLLVERSQRPEPHEKNP